MAVHQEAKTIEAFERAVIAREWMGAGHPENVEAIERHYHEAKAKMYELLGLTYRPPAEPDDDD
jgi:hypothetical protein